jgi:hypothetical protein
MWICKDGDWKNIANDSVVEKVEKKSEPVVEDPVVSEKCGTKPKKPKKVSKARASKAKSE